MTDENHTLLALIAATVPIGPQQVATADLTVVDAPAWAVGAETQGRAALAKTPASAVGFDPGHTRA
ncbi:hypothetical protein LO763_19550 [Glycomyces sp. A-F 0318]|uniref:hypothetical protein n=1 Tax=Glycomyces amatae TaxID=2881355 RepID=UPI001E359432|nr:hypothetical protein [Glycomyces amatae]MCD0445807.1 hypothetical protein [Glycomyces amatae]